MADPTTTSAATAASDAAAASQASSAAAASQASSAVAAPQASSAIAVAAPQALDFTPWLGLGTTVLSLLIVLVAAWLLLRWLNRARGGGRTRGEGPQVLRAVSLGARERLVVVRHRDTEYLLGVTAANVSLIDRRPIDDAPPRVEPTL